jgi:hypothetical protein
MFVALSSDLESLRVRLGRGEIFVLEISFICCSDCWRCKINEQQFTGRSEKLFSAALAGESWSIEDFASPRAPMEIAASSTFIGRSLRQVDNLNSAEFVAI